MGLCDSNEINQRMNVPISQVPFESPSSFYSIFTEILLKEEIRK